MSGFVPFSSDDEVVEIGRGLEDRTLPKSRWTHSAHFAAALWLFACRPEMVPSIAMPQMIRAYNEATGGANTDTSGYHETITQASLRATRSFLMARTEKLLFEVCNELMASPLGKPNWILTYWSRERLFSVEARREWIEPDIRPLPF
jgi:hypothetical protein